MDLFYRILRFFAIATSLMFFYASKSSSSSVVPVSIPGKMLGLFVISNSWKVSYTNPPSLSTEPILSTNTSVDQVKGKTNVTEITKYGNHGNLNASSSRVEGSFGEETSKPGNRTGRERRIRGSQSIPESRSVFHSTKSARRKKDRQGDGNLDKTSETESLRKKILSQLGTVDPLLCLPKALCGVSSRQKQVSINEQKGSENVHVSQNEVDNYLQLMQTIIPFEEERKKSSKKSKKKMRKSKVSNFAKSESDSSQTSSSEESKESEELPQDDIDYYREKAKMEKLMSEADYGEDPNWWDNILIPNTGPNTIDPYQHEGGPTGTTGTTGSSGSMWQAVPMLATGVTRLVRSMMPSMSWGFGKSTDVFGDDPFFQNFDSGRGFSSRSSRWSFGTGAKPSRSRSWNRKRKNRYRITKKNAIRKQAVLDQHKGEIEQLDDPTEKFELAVEIGKQLDNPKQCDYIFNGCPFSYDEILAIIDDTSSNKPKGPQVPELSEHSSQDEDYFPNPVTEEDSQSSPNEIDTIPITRTPSSRGKKRIIKHKMPNGEHLEISLKVSDAPYSNNGIMTMPQISFIPNPHNSDNLETVSKTPEEDDEKDPIDVQLDTQNSNNNRHYLRSDLPVAVEPESQTSQDALKNHKEKESSKEVIPDEAERPEIKKRNKKVQINKRPSRKPKGSKKKKEWGQQNVLKTVVSNPIIPYLLNQPQSQAPAPHVTNYHYYSANGPNTRYTYEPQQRPILKPQPDETHTSRPFRYSQDPEEPHPTSQRLRYSYKTNSQNQGYNDSPAAEKYSQYMTNSHTSYNQQQKQEQKQQLQQQHNLYNDIQPTPKPTSVGGSEERIIIRLPESSNNNNYYNLLPNPFSNSLFQYQHQPTVQPNYLAHRPQTFMPSSMYPQPHPYSGPGPYPFPTYPTPSMLSYLFGKK